MLSNTIPLVDLGWQASGKSLAIRYETRTGFDFFNTPFQLNPANEDTGSFHFINPGTPGTSQTSTFLAISPKYVLVRNGVKLGVNTDTPTELVEVGGNVKAVKFIGDGSLLTNLPGGSGGGGVSQTYVDAADAALQSKIDTEKNRIDTLVTGAPQALDTLKEIADQIAADEAGAAAMLATIQQHTQALSLKANLNGGNSFDGDQSITNGFLYANGSRLYGLVSDKVAEGVTNKYYTDAKVQALVDSVYTGYFNPTYSESPLYIGQAASGTLQFINSYGLADVGTYSITIPTQAVGNAFSSPGGSIEFRNVTSGTVTLNFTNGVTIRNSAAGNGTVSTISLEAGECITIWRSSVFGGQSNTQYYLVRRYNLYGTIASGGGGGTPDVTKAYVDAADSNLQTQIATERNRINTLVTGAPQALDTLKEIADQLAADEVGTAAILATQQQHTQQLANVVHRTGDETANGVKRFPDGIALGTMSIQAVRDAAYTLGVGGSFAVVQNTGADGEGAFRLQAKADFSSIQATKVNITDNQNLLLNADGGNVGVGGTRTPSEKLEVTGNVKANYFIGDGSRLTNLPTGGATAAISRFPAFTVTADGAQTITLPAGAQDALNVMVYEAAGYVRTIWIEDYSVASNTLTITANANLKVGDKVSGNYFAQSTGGGGNGGGNTTNMYVYP
jgi:hypothetical protein